MSFDIKFTKNIYLLTNKLISKNNLRKEPGITKKHLQTLCKKWSRNYNLTFNFLIFRIPIKVEFLKIVRYIHFFFLRKIRKLKFEKEKIKIKLFLEKKTYKGFCHYYGYPVNGQRSHSNGKTQKRMFLKRLAELKTIY